MKRTCAIHSLGRALSAAVAVLLLGGCGEAPPPETDDAFLQPADGGPPPTSMADMRHVTTPLVAVDGSGVSGESMAMYTDDAVIVSIDVHGLPEEGEFQVHVHSGSCEEGGRVAAPLNPLIATADGMGSSTTTVEPDEMPEEEMAFLQVHGGDGTPIACGEMGDDD